MPDAIQYLTLLQVNYQMKILRIIAILLLSFNSIGAIFGGWSFINDPSGGDLKIPITYLDHSPFTNFLIPGIILLPSMAYSVYSPWYGLFKWKKYAWLIIFQGVLLIGWIIVQMILLREIYYLQFIFGGIGVVLLLIGITLNKDARLKMPD